MGHLSGETFIVEKFKNNKKNFHSVTTPNPLWQKVVFWENVFVDIVATEREIIGMDQEPSEMIDRLVFFFLDYDSGASNAYLFCRYSKK